ncbi:lytic transglycosylase domain-containing protein [Chloroherpeton thalassium]|nr:lytic transglycosylase domain-containing protein [Chloroherpeton thalassium]
MLVRLFCFSCLPILAGCAATQTPISIDDYQLHNDCRLFTAPPKITLYPSRTWDDLRAAHRQIAEIDSTPAPANFADSTAIQIGYAHILYQAALKALQRTPMPDKETAREALTEALEIISSVLAQPDLKADPQLSRLALYVVQTYDDHIQKLSELEGDAPALLVYERLFGNPENTIVDENLFLGILLPKTEIPLELNYQVKKFITFYSSRFHDIFQRYLNRAEIYFPMMQKIIEEENVPPEIIYLTIVESGVNPHARSHANAVGAWQFIKSTGRLFDLHGNNWFDERQDIEKSTRSAMRLLKSLHQRYGDWYLALAAYNAGTGKINRAIRRSGKKNFWELTRYLRTETRQYVARYIAASIIAMHPEHFGFTSLEFEEIEETELVTVPNCLSLDVLSQSIGMPKEQLQFLNPELRQDVTPPAYKNYPLRVPKRLASSAQQAIDSIPDSEQLFFTLYKLKQNESLSRIAKKLDVTPSILQEINHLKSSVVPRGKVLMMPTSPEAFAETHFSRRELSDDSRERRRRRRRYKQPASEENISLVQVYRKIQTDLQAEEKE